MNARCVCSRSSPLPPASCCVLSVGFGAPPQCHHRAAVTLVCLAHVPTCPAAPRAALLQTPQHLKCCRPTGLLQQQHARQLRCTGRLKPAGPCSSCRAARQCMMTWQQQQQSSRQTTRRDAPKLSTLRQRAHQQRQRQKRSRAGVAVLLVLTVLTGAAPNPRWCRVRPLLCCRPSVGVCDAGIQHAPWEAMPCKQPQPALVLFCSRHA